MRLTFHSFRGYEAELWPSKEFEGRYFLRFEGVVEDRGEKIARVEGTVFLFDQMTNERESWGVNCDAHSQEMMDIYEAMCARSWYRDFVTPEFGSDLLYVESVKILPSYRGNGLGHALLLSAIQTFGRGCAAVVIEPHPLRSVDDQGHDLEGLNTPFDKAMAWDQLARSEAQYKVVAKKLAKHWAKLGFEKVPKSKRFWYLELSNFIVPEKIETQIQEQFGGYDDDEDADDDDDALIEGGAITPSPPLPRPARHLGLR